MVNLVPNFLRKIWDIWNIRGLVLTSFALQVCLLLFAPLRKCTNKSIVTWFIWSAYLLTDYVATFCVSLIFDQRDNFSDNSVNSYILVFWATFLLSHLGGLDTITAFALEDNELWSRHLLGLVFQVGAIVYVFFLTIPGNTLWIPTTLMFVAGMIKYIERIGSLFLASKNTLRKSCKELDLEKELSPSIDHVREAIHQYWYFVEFIPCAARIGGRGHVARLSDVELLQCGFSNFNIFKRLFIDKTLDLRFCYRSLVKVLHNMEPVNALTLIEVELNFMYEFFFTKASVLWNKGGCLLRVVSIISTVAALSVFATDKEHGFNKLEIEVTYMLLFGAVAIDTMLLLRFIFSDRSIITCSQRQSSQAPEKLITKLANKLKANLSEVVLIPFLKFREPKWSKCKKGPYAEFHSLSTNLLFRKWSGKISGHDFIMYCLHKTKEGKLNIGGESTIAVKFLKQTVNQVIDYLVPEEVVKSWIYKANNPFLEELWEFIFKELQIKFRSVVLHNAMGNVNEICEATGEQVLEKGQLDPETKDQLMRYVNSDEICTFGERIMVWHMATGLCYYSYPKVDESYAKDRCFSKLLSDYMLYLLVMEPSVISVAVGIDRDTIQDIILVVKEIVVAACGETSKHIKKNQNQNQKSLEQSACEAMINALSVIELDNKSKLLIYACDLANKLGAILPQKRWKMLAQIWVEMLSYVALHTKPDMHVQQLSKGGQLISLVWLLMLHMGLGAHQFRKISRSEFRRLGCTWDPRNDCIWCYSKPQSESSCIWCNPESLQTPPTSDDEKSETTSEETTLEEIISEEEIMEEIISDKKTTRVMKEEEIISDKETTSEE